MPHLCLKGGVSELGTLQQYSLPYSIPPSRRHWFPTWTQVQQYPYISAKDNNQDSDPALGAGDMDAYTVAELSRPPALQRKAIYHCSIDGNLVNLVAIAPGTKLNIDSRSKWLCSC